jgi:cupin fold WbuC family metalloprotein
MDRALLERLAREAAASPRGRTNFNFHDGPEDNPHRFLNALSRGSYCAPHCHVTPPKDECFIVLQGEVGVWLFDDAGSVVERYALGRGQLFGVDIPAGAWHTVAALTSSAVCFEVKPGPWDARTDKAFAPWAPREGDDGAAAYLEQLLLDFA